MGITAFPFSSVIDVPTARILGRDDAGTGSAEALTTAEVLTLLSVYTTAQVDTLLSGKSNTGHTHDASAITSGTLDIARIPLGATSTTVCVGNDARLSDARTPIAHTHAAGDITSGIIATARLATGAASASTYLRGDQTWASVSAGVGGSTGSVDNAVLRADGTGGATLQASLVSVDDAGQIQFRGTYSVYNVQLRNPDWGSSHGILLSSLGTVFITNGGYVWRFESGTGHLLGISTGQIQFTSDTRLQRGDAAGILRQFSGTQSQKYELYNIYTSDTSFERLNIAWANDVCTIAVTAGSAGGILRGLRIGGASTSLLGFYGATPVDRPDTIADPAGGGTIDTEARTAINTIIDRLQELGLIA